MKKKEIDEFLKSGYKRARFHGIKCLYRPETHDLRTTNFFCKMMITFNIWLDIEIFRVKAFEIEIIDD